MKREQYLFALEDFNSALANSDSPSVKLWFLKGKSLFKLGSAEDAIHALCQALHIDIAHEESASLLYVILTSELQMVVDRKKIDGYDGDIKSSMGVLRNLITLQVSDSQVFEKKLAGLLSLWIYIQKMISSYPNENYLNTYLCNLMYQIGTTFVEKGERILSIPCLL